MEDNKPLVPDEIRRPAQRCSNALCIADSLVKTILSSMVSKRRQGFGEEANRYSDTLNQEVTSKA